MTNFKQINFPFIYYCHPFKEELCVRTKFAKDLELKIYNKQQNKGGYNRDEF